MYSLNNIPLSDFGFVPGKQPNSNIALSGFLNFPSRIGDTEWDWADEDGIEAYVAADEIFFGGRDLNLTGYIKGIDRYDCEGKRIAFIRMIDSFTGLVPLTSKWGTYNVGINGSVESKYLAKNYLSLSLPMREPLVDLTGIIPVADGSEIGIDGISFKSMGGVALELSGDRRTRTAPKSFDITAYGKEIFIPTKTGAPELTLKLYIKQPTYAAFQSKITGLYALLSAPGLRQLTYLNDKLRSFFVKGGFTVSSIYSTPSSFVGVLEIRITQSGSPTRLEDLMINGATLTINNEKVTIKVRI